MKPMPLRLLAAVSTLSLLAGSPGCYYAFGTAPPVRHTAAVDSVPAGPSTHAPVTSVNCTRSRALPITDAVLAVEGAIATGFGALILSTSDDGSLSAGEAKAFGAMFLLSGLPMLIGNGLSARRGFSDPARCRALR